MIRFAPATEFQKAAAVARAYTLQDACLVSLNAARPVPAAESATMPLDTQLDEKSTKAELREDGKVLLVTVAFGVRAGLLKDSDFATHIQVEGAFELEYRRTDDRVQFGTSELQAFASLNGTHNAWPYMREAVANLFCRMGYPPFTLESLVIMPQPPTAPPPSLLLPLDAPSKAAPSTQIGRN